MSDKEIYTWIYFKDKKYYEIGCANCEHSCWKVYTDGKEYVASCINCGHVSRLNIKYLQDVPNKTSKKD